MIDVNPPETVLDDGQVRPENDAFPVGSRPETKAAAIVGGLHHRYTRKAA